MTTTQSEKPGETACDLCSAAQAVMDAVVNLPDEPHYESLNESVEHVPLADIAKYHGVPVPLLKRRLGVGVRRTQWTPTMVSQFKADVDGGMNATELAKKWGMSKSRVNQVIAEHEIDMNTGRRVRARADALRFQELSDAILYVYDIEPDLNRKAIHAWVTQHFDLDASYEEVSDVITRTGLVTGDLEALPPGNRMVVDGNDAWVEDHTLPGETQAVDVDATADVDRSKEPFPPGTDSKDGKGDVDDVVTVPDKAPLDWVRQWMDEEPGGTFEDYGRWAGRHDGAPSTTEIREEFGGWGKAKAAASA